MGVQTLNFKPYRVDLTPFAGLLADGQAHTMGLSVFNANSYFLATANLLAYTDRRAKKVTGGILENTLAAAPTPVITEALKTDSSGNITGTVTVISARAYAISGYLNTSHGKIKTTVAATLGFSNSQTFNITQADYLQAITQTTTVDSKTTVSDGWVSQTTETTFSYPFTLNYSQIQNADGSFNVTTTSDQQDWLDVNQMLNRFSVYTATLRSAVKSANTLSLTLPDL